MSRGNEYFPATQNNMSNVNNRRKNGMTRANDMDEFVTIDRMKFSRSSIFHSDENGNYFRGFKGLRNADVVVRHLKINDVVWRGILNDIEISTFCERQCVTSVLRADDSVIVDEMAFIPLEPFRSTIQNCFFEIPSLSMEKFFEISKGIIDAVGNVHAQGIVINNVSSLNMVYCYENGKLKVKICNLSEAGRLSEVHKDSFSNDIMEVGYVALSPVLKAEDVQYMRESNLNLNERENFIYEKIKSVEFIESLKKRSFAHLVAALIEGKESLIHNYLSYPFFWDEMKYEDVIKTTNSWIDKNSRDRNKEVMKKFNEKFNYSKENDWKKILAKDGIKVTGNYDATAGDLARFFRNKVVHRKDYHDELAPFFKKRGGPFKYFFETFDPLFHILSTFYVENRLHETDRVDDTKSKQQENDQANDVKPAPKSNNNLPSPSFSATNNKDTNHIVAPVNKNNILRIHESREPHKNQNGMCFAKKNQNHNIRNNGSRLSK